MQNKLELSLLIDYYGAFLTDNQCEMLKLNCEEDFSLAEIAEQKGISRGLIRPANGIIPSDFPVFGTSPKRVVCAISMLRPFHGGHHIEH